MVSSPLTVRADLLVITADNGSGSGVVYRFNDRTGAFINSFGKESEAYEGLKIGPDGRIYVTCNTLGYGDIYRFNRKGQFMGASTNGHLRTPLNLAFGPDGNCYAIGSNWPASPELWQILRYDRTGAFRDNFITNAGVPRDLGFGPDGKLYLADGDRGIVRYDGATGQFVDVFVPLGTGGLTDARALLFGPDGNLYVSSWTMNAVVRFNGKTGAFLDNFVASGSGGLNQPGGLAFGPDGNLYVSSTLTHSILRYDGRTGAFLNAFVGGGQVRFPANLVFLPAPPRLEVTRVGGSVRIAWPNSAGDWTLYFQRGVGGISTAWQAISNAPVLEGTNYVVTDTCAEKLGLYRLEQR